MRLTWRDGAATTMAGLVLAILLAATQAWSWPLLGDFRAGVVALAIVGFAMCSVGMVAGPSEFRHPLVILASGLGVAGSASSPCSTPPRSSPTTRT